MNSIPASHLAVGSCLVLLLGGIAKDAAPATSPVENEWRDLSYHPPVGAPGALILPAIEGCALRSAAGKKRSAGSGDLSPAEASPFLVSGRIERVLPERPVAGTDRLF